MIPVQRQNEIQYAQLSPTINGAPAQQDPSLQNSSLLEYRDLCTRISQKISSLLSNQQMQSASTQRYESLEDFQAELAKIPDLQDQPKPREPQPNKPPKKPCAHEKVFRLTRPLPPKKTVPRTPKDQTPQYQSLEDFQVELAKIPDLQIPPKASIQPDAVTAKPKKTQQPKTRKPREQYEHESVFQLDPPNQSQLGQLPPKKAAKVTVIQNNLLSQDAVSELVKIPDIQRWKVNKITVLQNNVLPQDTIKITIIQNNQLSQDAAEQYPTHQHENLQGFQEKEQEQRQENSTQDSPLEDLFVHFFEQLKDPHDENQFPSHELNEQNNEQFVDEIEDQVAGESGSHDDISEQFLIFSDDEDPSNNLLEDPASSLQNDETDQHAPHDNLDALNPQNSDGFENLFIQTP